MTPAAAYQLVITAQPSTAAAAGVPFATQPVVEEQDQYGNLEIADDSAEVKASLESGTGPLQGTVTVQVSGGIATFTDLADDTVETITLQFTGDGLQPATSGSIVVGVRGRPASLVIDLEPSPSRHGRRGSSPSSR